MLTVRQDCFVVAFVFWSGLRRSGNDRWITQDEVFVCWLALRALDLGLLKIRSLLTLKTPLRSRPRRFDRRAICSTSGWPDSGGLFTKICSSELFSSASRFEPSGWSRSGSGCAKDGFDFGRLPRRSLNQRFRFRRSRRSRVCCYPGDS